MECLEGHISDYVISEDDSYNDTSTYETSNHEDGGDHPQGTFTNFEELRRKRTFSSLDPSQYVSNRYYSFEKKSYDLMKDAMQGNISVTLEALKSCDSRGMLDLKRWRKMKDNLCLEKNEDCSTYLCLSSPPPKMKISYIEEWESIVQECHTMGDGTCHLGIDETIQKINSIWCVDIRRHGIPIAYVKDLLNVCECKRWNQNPNVSQSHPRKDTTILLRHERSVEAANVDQALMEIMLEHKVRLVMVRSSKNHGRCKTVVDYACHRGGKAERKGTKKRLRRSKKCGCPFKVRVVYFQDTQNASISLFPLHEGHSPGTREDLYHLPVHPNVIECCMEDLFDVGSSRHVAKMSLSKERLHYERSSPIDQAMFRFFMIQREISMLSYQIQNQGTIYMAF